MTIYRNLDLRVVQSQFIFLAMIVYKINLPRSYDSKIAIKRCFKYPETPGHPGLQKMNNKIKKLDFATLYKSI